MAVLKTAAFASFATRASWWSGGESNPRAVQVGSRQPDQIPPHVATTKARKGLRPFQPLVDFATSLRILVMYVAMIVCTISQSSASRLRGTNTVAGGLPGMGMMNFSTSG